MLFVVAIGYGDDKEIRRYAIEARDAKSAIGDAFEIANGHITVSIIEDADPEGDDIDQTYFL